MPFCWKQHFIAQSKRTTDRRGFTLLEAVVALTITGTLLLGGRWILEAAAAGAEDVHALAIALDRRANAERFARDLLGRTEIRPDRRRFVGTPQVARIPTYCETPEGWLESCEATLGVVEQRDGVAVVLAIPTHDVVAVRSVVAAASIKYLASADLGGIWLSDWDSDLHAPLAVGVFTPGDTLILRIGAFD